MYRLPAQTINLIQFILFKDDGFADVLYNTQWYNLPLNYQLDIMHLINRKQNGITITIGPFGSINRELFKIVSYYRFNGKYSIIYFNHLHFMFIDYKQGLLFCYVSAQLYCLNRH